MNHHVSYLQLHGFFFHFLATLILASSRSRMILLPSILSFSSWATTTAAVSQCVVGQSAVCRIVLTKVNRCSLSTDHNMDKCPLFLHQQQLQQNVCTHRDNVWDYGSKVSPIVEMATISSPAATTAHVLKRKSVKTEIRCEILAAGCLR